MAADETVGDRVRRYRRLRKLTQEALAASAGVDRSYLGKIEVGDVLEPGADTVKRLAVALGVPLRAIAEPLGWYEGEPASTDDWVVRMRGDPELTDGDKTIIEDLAARLRESKPS